MTRKKLTLAIGILSMNLLLMSGSIVGAAIAAMARTFSSEPISKVQLVTSISQLGQVVGTLLFAWLTYKLTCKGIGLLAVAFVAVSGMLPIFMNSSLNIILACMIGLGFGCGLISNVAPVLLQEHFEGEQRATVMGWAVGFNNIGMMVFTALGGILGGTNWHNLFWIYAFAILIFLFVWLVVPKDSKVVAEIAADGKKLSLLQSMQGLSGLVYVLLLVTFITSICIMLFTANQSILLSAKGNGTTYTATVTAIGNVGGILTAFGLNFIRKMTRANTIAWGFVAFALSFVFIALFNNVICHIIGNMFSGMGIVMVNATVGFELSVLANQRQFPVVIAANTLVSSIAGAIAPILLAALGISAGYNSFIAGIALSLIAAALLLLFRVGSRIEKKNNQPAPIDSTEVV